MRSKNLLIGLTLNISLLGGVASGTTALGYENEQVMEKIIEQVRNDTSVDGDFDIWTLNDWFTPANQRRFVVQKTLEKLRANGDLELKSAIEIAYQELENKVLQKIESMEKDDFINETQIKKEATEDITYMDAVSKVRSSTKNLQVKDVESVEQNENNRHRINRKNNQVDTEDNDLEYTAHSESNMNNSGSYKNGMTSAFLPRKQYKYDDEGDLESSESNMNNSGSYKKGTTSAFLPRKQYKYDDEGDLESDDDVNDDWRLNKKFSSDSEYNNYLTSYNSDKFVGKTRKQRGTEKLSEGGTPDDYSFEKKKVVDTKIENSVNKDDNYDNVEPNVDNTTLEEYEVKDEMGSLDRAQDDVYNKKVTNYLTSNQDNSSEKSKNVSRSNIRIKSDRNNNLRSSYPHLDSDKNEEKYEDEQWENENDYESFSNTKNEYDDYGIGKSNRNNELDEVNDNSNEEKIFEKDTNSYSKFDEENTEKRYNSYNNENIDYQDNSITRTDVTRKKSNSEKLKEVKKKLDAIKINS